MTRKPALKLVRGLDAIAERWVKLKREIDRRKAELEELEPPIREALERAPDRERKFGPHLLLLTEDTTRTNFDRKRAIADLGDETLAPYLYETPVRGSIRVK
jgi:hypothetical protein